MRMTTAVLMLVVVAIPASAQKPLPIIDMHLHASAADDNGPPPLALCVPPLEGQVGDPRRAWRDVFVEWQKKPPCPDPYGRPGPTMRS